MKLVLRMVATTLCALACMWLPIAGCRSEPLRLTEDDVAVLTAALTDFLSSDAETELTLAKDRESATNRTQLLMVDYTRRISAHPSNRELNDYAAAAGGDLTTGLKQSIRARNRTSVTLGTVEAWPSNFTLISREAIDWAPGEFKVAHPAAKAFVHPCLPGYDQRGASALVLFSFGPRFSHGSEALYRLTKSGGVWKVDWRYFAYFL